MCSESVISVKKDLRHREKMVGEKGNNDLNRSRESLPSNAFNHPITANDCTCA
jgi:hypothetical protein